MSAANFRWVVLGCALFSGCDRSQPPQEPAAQDPAPPTETAPPTDSAPAPLDSDPPAETAPDTHDSAPPADTQDTATTEPETSPFSVEAVLPCEVDEERDGIFRTIEGCSLVLGRVEGAGATVRVLLVDRAPTDGGADAPVVVLESGGPGVPYTSPPGAAEPEGEDSIEHYVKRINDAGYRTVEIGWMCPGQWRGAAYCNAMSDTVQDWMQQTVEGDPYHGEGWSANLEGTGLPGAGRRAAAIYQWIADQAEGTACIHGHSGGSGRVIIGLTQPGFSDQFEGVLFTGGPVWSYVPWFCGVDEPPGTLPDWWVGGTIDGDSARYEDTRSCSPDVAEKREDCPLEFVDCHKHVYDPVMMEDSLQCIGGLDAIDLEVGVVMGGADVSSAWKHLLQWLGGIQLGAAACPAMGEAPGRDGLVLRQGFCDEGDAVFAGCNGTPDNCEPRSCASWDVVSGRGYDASLSNVGHDVMLWPEGAEVSVELLTQVCPIP